MPALYAAVGAFIVSGLSLDLQTEAHRYDELHHADSDKPPMTHSSDKSFFALFYKNARREALSTGGRVYVSARF